METEGLKQETLEIIANSQNPSEEEEGEDDYDDDPDNAGDQAFIVFHTYTSIGKFYILFENL